MYMQTLTYQQVNHYYPYGGVMGESTGGDVQRYKYNGKELDRMHGLDWYDYGARHYDAAIVSWPTMDLLAEKYYSISPYVYCGGNPINAIDINGEDNYTINSLGKVSLIKETDDKYDFNRSSIDKRKINTYSDLIINIKRRL